MSTHSHHLSTLALLGPPFLSPGLTMFLAFQEKSSPSHFRASREAREHLRAVGSFPRPLLQPQPDCCSWAALPSEGIPWACHLPGFSWGAEQSCTLFSDGRNSSSATQDSALFSIENAHTRPSDFLFGSDHFLPWLVFILRDGAYGEASRLDSPGLGLNHPSGLWWEQWTLGYAPFLWGGRWLLMEPGGTAEPRLGLHPHPGPPSSPPPGRLIQAGSSITLQQLPLAPLLHDVSASTTQSTGYV